MRLSSGDLLEVCHSPGVFWIFVFLSLLVWVFCFISHFYVVVVGFFFFFFFFSVVCVVFMFVRVCRECLPEVPLPGRRFVSVCFCCECLAEDLSPGALFDVCACSL